MRWIRRSTVVPLSTLAIAAAGVSFAHAACPPQDLVCLGEEAVGTGQGSLDDSIGPVDTPGATRSPRSPMRSTRSLVTCSIA